MVTKFESFLENYSLFDRIFYPPKDELGRKLKFTKSKIMRKPMYRTVSLKDWEYVLKTGKFRKSLPIDNEEYLKKIKEADPKKYKEIRYAEKSRDYTRVTPYPEYAKEHHWREDSDVFIEFKPMYDKLKPSTELGGYDEIFAYDLSLNDIKKAINKKGEILYNGQ
jgi:hypothetical protein